MGKAVGALAGRRRRDCRRIASDGACSRAWARSPRSGCWVRRLTRTRAGATSGTSAPPWRQAWKSLEGLPEDEIFVYEDALRQGRSVVVALADDEAFGFAPSRTAEEAGRRVGGRGPRAMVDRPAQRRREPLFQIRQEASPTTNSSIVSAFEAALHARTRCMEFDQVSAAR